MRGKPILKKVTRILPTGSFPLFSIRVSSVFSFVQKVQKVRFLVYFLAHFAMAVETKIFLSKKKKTIMSEYRSPLVEPEPVPEPVKVKEPPVPEKVDEVNPEISKSAHSVESVKESDSSESDEEFSDCESEDEIQTDPRFFHSSVPCTHQVRVQDFETLKMKSRLYNNIIYLYNKLV